MNEDILEIYEDKCDDCMHKLKDYCRGYQVLIELINTNNCKRKKRS